jgi:hypothetical protein
VPPTLEASVTPGSDQTATGGGSQPESTGTLQAGPWLAFVTDQGVWASNADGSGLTLLVSGGVTLPGGLARAVSPGGAYIAYITTSDPKGGSENLTLSVDLTLNLVHLPDGAITEVTPLNTDETRPSPQDAPGDPSVEAYRAVLDEESMAWSPDGSRLAFMGLIDGPSSDLYVYSLADQSIKRLTSGSGQGYQPSWSPDGRWIVHAAAESFGTGAGASIASVWAAAADGSAIKLLYEPTSSGDERFISWLGGDTLIVRSWEPGCGAYDLRALDITTGEARQIAAYLNEIDGVAINPRDGLILYSLADTVAQCQHVDAYGLFLSDLSGAVRQVYSGNAYQVIDAPQSGRFFARTDTSVVSVDYDGKVAETSAPGAMLPIVSPDGTQWVFTSNYETYGLWIGPVSESAPPAQVYEKAVNEAVWDASNSLVFFMNDLGLYRLDVHTLQVQAVSEDIGTDRRMGLVWVTP